MPEKKSNTEIFDDLNNDIIVNFANNMGYNGEEKLKLLNEKIANGDKAAIEMKSKLLKNATAVFNAEKIMQGDARGQVPGNITDPLKGVPLDKATLTARQTSAEAFTSATWNAFGVSILKGISQLPSASVNTANWILGQVNPGDKKEFDTSWLDDKTDTVTNWLDSNIGAYVDEVHNRGGISYNDKTGKYEFDLNIGAGTFGNLVGGVASFLLPTWAAKLGKAGKYKQMLAGFAGGASAQASAMFDIARENGMLKNAEDRKRVSALVFATTPVISLIDMLTGAEAMFGRAGVNKIAGKTLMDSLKNIGEKGLTREVFRDAVTGTTRGFLKTLKEEGFNTRTLSGSIFQLVKSPVRGFVEEGVTEGLQSAIEKGAYQIYDSTYAEPQGRGQYDQDLYDGNGFLGLSKKEFADVLNEGFLGGLMGGGMGILHKVGAKEEMQETVYTWADRLIKKGKTPDDVLKTVSTILDGSKYFAESSKDPQRQGITNGESIYNDVNNIVQSIQTFNELGTINNPEARFQAFSLGNAKAAIDSHIQGYESQLGALDAKIDELKTADPSNVSAITAMRVSRARVENNQPQIEILKKQSTLIQDTLGNIGRNDAPDTGFQAAFAALNPSDTQNVPTEEVTEKSESNSLNETVRVPSAKQAAQEIGQGLVQGNTTVRDRQEPKETQETPQPITIDTQKEAQALTEDTEREIQSIRYDDTAALPEDAYVSDSGLRGPSVEEVRRKITDKFKTDVEGLKTLQPAVQEDQNEKILEQGQKMLDAVNDGRKGRVKVGDLKLIEVPGDTSRVILEVQNKEGQKVYNVLNRDGSIPVGLSSNWRSISHIQHDLNLTGNLPVQYLFTADQVLQSRVSQTHENLLIHQDEHTQRSAPLQEKILSLKKRATGKKAGAKLALKTEIDKIQNQLAVIDTQYNSSTWSQWEDINRVIREKLEAKGLPTDDLNEIASNFTEAIYERPGVEYYWNNTGEEVLQDHLAERFPNAGFQPIAAPEGNGKQGKEKSRLKPVQAVKKATKSTGERTKTISEKIASYDFTDILDRALVYFATGGRINTEDLIRELGLRDSRTGKIRSIQEFNSRIQFHSKAAPTMDRLVENMVGMQADLTAYQDARNALIEVMRSYTKSSMITELTDKMVDLDYIRDYGMTREQFTEYTTAQAQEQAIYEMADFELDPDEVAAQEAIRHAVILSEINPEEYTQYSQLFDKFVDDQGDINWPAELEYEKENENRSQNNDIRSEGVRGNANSTAGVNESESRALSREQAESLVADQLSAITRLQNEHAALQKKLTNNLQENQVNMFGDNQTQSLFNDRLDQQQLVDAKHEELEAARASLVKAEEDLIRISDTINQYQFSFQNISDEETTNNSDTGRDATSADTGTDENTDQAGEDPEIRFQRQLVTVENDIAGAQKLSETIGRSIQATSRPGSTEGKAKYETEPENTQVEPRLLSASEVNTLQKILQRVFPNIQMYSDPQTYAAALAGATPEAVRSTPSGFILDGKLHVNPQLVDTSTQIHEVIHLTTSWAAKYSPEVYRKIINSGKTAPAALTDRVRIMYPELDPSSDAFHEEVFATYAGKHLSPEVEKLLSTESAKPWYSKVREVIRDLVSRITAYVRNKLGIDIQDLKQKDFLGMGIAEFSEYLGKRLLQGNKLSDITSEEIAEIERAREHGAQVRALYTGPKFIEYISQDENDPIYKSYLTATEMLSRDGEDIAKIKAVTGWYINPFVGLWEYEIDDSTALLTEDGFLARMKAEVESTGKATDPVELDSIFYSEAYKYYPGAGKVLINFGMLSPENSKIHGIFNHNTNLITINLRNYEPGYSEGPTTRSASYHDSIDAFRGGRTRGDIESIIVHELQHFTQRYEGTHMGGNEWIALHYLLDKYKDQINKEQDVISAKKGTEIQKVFNARKDALYRILKDEYSDKTPERVVKETYRNYAGEIQAWDTLFRKNMTDEERRQNLPYNYSDVNPKNAIIRYGSNPSNAIGSFRFQKTAVDVAQLNTQNALNTYKQQIATLSGGNLQAIVSSIQLTFTEYVDTLAANVNVKGNSFLSGDFANGWADNDTMLDVANKVIDSNHTFQTQYADAVYERLFGLSDKSILNQYNRWIRSNNYSMLETDPTGDLGQVIVPFEDSVDRSSILLEKDKLQNHRSGLMAKIFSLSINGKKLSSIFPKNMLFKSLWNFDTLGKMLGEKGKTFYSILIDAVHKARAIAAPYRAVATYFENKLLGDYGDLTLYGGKSNFATVEKITVVDTSGRNIELSVGEALSIIGTTRTQIADGYKNNLGEAGVSAIDSVLKVENYRGQGDIEFTLTQDEYDRLEATILNPNYLGGKPAALLNEVLEYLNRDKFINVHGVHDPSKRSLVDAISRMYEIDEAKPLGKSNMYYPIYTYQAEREEDSEDEFRNSSQLLDDVSILHARKKKVAPLVIKDILTVTHEYNNKSVNFIEYWIPIRNINVFLNRNEQWFKNNNLQYISDSLREYTRNLNNYDKLEFEANKGVNVRSGKALLSAFVVSRLSFNLFTALKQFWGFPIGLGLNIVENKYLLREMPNVAKEMGFSYGAMVREFYNYVQGKHVSKVLSLQPYLDEVARNPHAYEILNRLTNQNLYNMDDIISQSFSLNSHSDNKAGMYWSKFLNFFKGPGMEHIKQADVAIIVGMYRAAQAQVNDSMPTATEDERMRMTADMAGRLMYATQQTNYLTDKTQLQMSHSIWDRTLSIFTAQQQKMINTVGQKYIEYAKETDADQKKKRGEEFMWAVTTMSIGNAAYMATITALASVLRGQGGDDEEADALFADKFKWAFARELAGYVPGYVGEIPAAVVTQFDTELWGDKVGGLDVFAGLNNFLTGTAQIVKTQYSDKDEFQRNKAVHDGFEKAVKGMADATGVSQEMRRMLQAIIE